MPSHSRRRGAQPHANAGAALLYCRQSKSDGEADDSISLAAQAAILTGVADDRGWSVVAVVKDADLKGYQDESERPGLAEVLARADGGEFGHLLVYDLSRLARSLRIQEQIVWRLAKAGADIVSVREPWTEEPFVRQVLGAVAERQTAVIAGYTRSALAARVQRGLPHGVAPWGYVRAEPKGPYAPDEETAPLVTELFARYAAGEQVMELAADLTRRGIPTPRGYAVWHPESVAQFLDNRTYLGEVAINGERVAGAHAPLVDQATWAVVEARRAAGHRAPRPKAASSWLEGLLLHDCADGDVPRGRMYLMVPSAGRRGQQPYFRCNKISLPYPRRPHVCRLRPSSVSAWIAEARVRGRLRADLPRAISVDLALRAAREEHRRLSPLAERRRRELADRARRADDHRRKAEELYLSGARDRAWFDLHDAQIAAELAAAAAEEAGLPALVDEPALRDVAVKVAGFAEVVRLATDDELAEMLFAVGVAVLGAGGVGVEYRGPAARLLGRRTVQTG